MDKNLRDIFANVNNVKIIEAVTDPDVLLEYFVKMRKYRKDINRDEILKAKDDLFKNDVPVEDKKILLVRLASIDEVEVYRTLEKYAENPDEELKQWASLALQENNALLQSSLLEEPYILISSGLGGKDDKLRYFVVLISKDNKELSQVQKQIIEKETLYGLEEVNGELEKIEFGKYFATLIVLIPFKITAFNVFSKVIESANELGDFLDEYFIVRNEKIFSLEETEDMINNKEEERHEVDEFDLELSDNERNMIQELEELMNSFDLEALREEDDDEDYDDQEEDDDENKDDQDDDLDIDDLLSDDDN